MSFSIIVFISVVFVFVVAIVSKVVEKAKAKNIDRMLALSESIGNHIKEVQSADSVSSFLNSWDEMKEEIIVLVQNKKKIPDKYTRNCIDDASQSIREMDRDFQWMLCNVIDRMEKRISREIKATYKYSKDHKERLLSIFRKEIETGYDYYSEETRALANEKLENVACLVENEARSSRLKYSQQETIRRETSSAQSSLKNKKFDQMDGQSFELFCADLLRANGFTNIEMTRGSGDQGVDILAEKDGIHFAIQCKCYSSDLGNKPIQEVFAGKSIYHCQVAAVMTNRYFTPGAFEAAKATGVLLWDRRKLQSLIDNANT